MDLARYECVASYYDDLMDSFARKKPTLAPNILKVPVTDYTDSGRWEREVKFIRSTPMMLALSGELAEPGSYWAMTRVGIPMILVRQKSGEVRQFINACRHRAPRWSRRQATALHVHLAWTYGLDGRLLALPKVLSVGWQLVSVGREERPSVCPARTILAFGVIHFAGFGGFGDGFLAN